MSRNTQTKSTEQLVRVSCPVSKYAIIDRFGGRRLGLVTLNRKGRLVGKPGSKAALICAFAVDVAGRQRVKKKEK